MAVSGKIPADGFKEEDQIRDWLQSQSRQVIVVMAARSALRVWPLLGGSKGNIKKFSEVANTIILPCFRAVTASLSAGNWPDSSAGSAADSAADSVADSAANSASRSASHSAYSAARSAAYSAFSAAYSAADFAARSAFSALSAATYASATYAAAIYDAFTADAHAIENGQMSATDLAVSPLWGSGIDDMPTELRQVWQQQEQQLLALNQNWQVWTNWYAARLRGDPMPKDRELAFITELDEEDWKGSSAEINAKLQKILDRFDVKLPRENEVPKQTQGALHFIRNSDGKVDADPDAESNQLAIDRDARDRHSECKRLTEVLREKTEQFEAGGNGNQELLGEIDLFLEALGSKVEQVRPGLLIPRGEVLRTERTTDKDRGKESNFAPLADEVKVAFDKWEPAYNQMVALDLVLARSDQATYNPDTIRILIAPEDGMGKVISARDEGAATDNAVDALAEEAKVAPSDPDANNRNSRRFSEGVKNFSRAMVSAAISGGKWVIENPKDSAALIAMGVAGVASNGFSLVKAAKWMLANEKWLLEKYADDEKMLDVIKRTLNYLKTMPLK